MTPRVSVVVTCYNYGHFLADALRSVQCQTFDDLEVLVIDDGSTDNTCEVLQPFLTDSRFVYHQTGHVGQPRAKNAGIRLARAPLVAFLDADDAWFPTKLAKQVDCMDHTPDAGVVYTRRRLMDPDGWEIEHCQVPLPRGRVTADLFRLNYVCFSSAMIRREVFDTVGLFDESLQLAIDYDLWLRASSRFPFDFVDEPLVLYRTGHGSLSRRTEERIRTVMDIMDRFLHERGGNRLVPQEVQRISWAETLCNLGHVCRARSSSAAAGCFLRAIGHVPTHGPAWRGLARALVGETLWERSRRLVGRRDPGYWSRRRPDTGEPVLQTLRRQWTEADTPAAVC